MGRTVLGIPETRQETCFPPTLEGAVRPQTCPLQALLPQAVVALSSCAVLYAMLWMDLLQEVDGELQMFSRCLVCMCAVCGDTGAYRVRECTMCQETWL